MKLIRKYANDLAFTRKHVIELNLLLMECFFPQRFTDSERKVLVEYLLLETVDLFSKESKEIIMKNCKLRNLKVINVYNQRIRNKGGFIVKEGVWILNPMLVLPKNISAYELQIKCNLTKK